MLTPDNITEQDVVILCERPNIRSGENLANAVHRPTRTDNVLQGLVHSPTGAHSVRVEFREDGVHTACSCSPPRKGVACPHAAALLFNWVRATRKSLIENSPNHSSIQDDYPFYVRQMPPPKARRPSRSPSWLKSTIRIRHAAEEEEIHQWIKHLTAQEWRQMAKLRGWKLRGTRKSELLPQVARYILDPENIRQAVAQQDEPHRRMLRALVLTSEYKTNPPAGLPERVAQMSNRSDILAYSADLCQWGLAIPKEFITDYHSHSDYVPPAISRYFPPLLAEVIPPADLSTATGDIRLANPYPFVRAFGQVMLLLNQTRPSLRPPMPTPLAKRLEILLSRWDYDPHEVRQGQISHKIYLAEATLSVPPPSPHFNDETLARLSSIVGDEAQLEFIYSLMVEVGIIYPGSPVTFWNRVHTRFMMHDELTQRAILARAYFQMTNWSVLWDVLRQDRELQLRRSLNRHMTPRSLGKDLMRFRRLLLRALSFLPDDQWVPLDGFLKLMRLIWPTFDRSVWTYARQTDAPNKWFIAHSDTGEPVDTDDASTWNRVQGALIRQTLGGPLHWLGLADLAFDEHGDLIAFRLHGLSDLFLDLVEVVPAPPQAAVPTTTSATTDDVLSYDGETISVIPSAIGVHGHDLLGKIASLESAAPQRFTYRLNPDVAYRSFSAGETFDEIVSRWQELLPVPMPEGIQARLREWWESYGRVRIYRDLTVIELGDDYALREIQAIAPLHEYLIAEISPRLVLISKEGVKPLVQALEKAGYTPSVK